MRGKKSYNIRNIEAHLNVNMNKLIEENNSTSINKSISTNNFLLNRQMQFQRNNQYQESALDAQQQMREYVNSKFGATKYASNLVSGKMFKKL
jgi:hypothetical protein